MLIMSRVILTLGLIMGFGNLVRFYFYETELPILSNSTLGFFIASFGILFTQLAKSEQPE